MPTLLDTHAWIWWVTNDKRLSRRAASAIERASASGDLHLSMISIWELAKKIEKNQVTLDRDLDAWLDLATTAKALHIVELSRPILLESCRLPAPFHGDPADQIIVATARHHAGILVTKDRRIREYAHARTLW